MKKNLLALFALGALYSTNAQTVYVKDKATVAVKSNTLLYMGNGMELASSTAKTIINEGNIQINLSDLLPGFTSSTVPANTPPTDTPHYFKNFNNDGTTHNDGSNFVNTYTDATHYGQLMFTLAKGNKDPNNSSDNNRILGKVTMEQPYANPANFNWLPIALPFNGPTGIVSQTVQDFYTATFNLPFLRYADTSKSRYSSSMLLWDDKDFYYATMFADNPLLAVTNQRVFILNLSDNTLANTFTANTGTAARIQYKGYPFGDASRPVKLNTIAGNSTNPFWEDRGAKYTPTEPWSVWSERKNPANERYKTFIGDSFVTYDPTSIKYGKWLINFGNPFTHNIDLAAAFAQNSAGFPENLLAIQKVGTQVKWVKGTGNTTPTQASLKASVTDNSTSATPLAKNPDIINKKWMGDANALIVKPFEIVTFKLDRQVKGSYGIGFYDNSATAGTKTGAKTFNMTASGLTGSATPGGKSSENNTDINTNVSNINSANPGLYQLGLQVTNQQGTHTNNVYFAAVDANVTGNKNGFELEFDDFGSDSGFWLNQENTDGTTDDGSHLYINGFNMNDYVAKPLRLTFYKNPEDSNTTFSIGANLAEGSTLNDGLQNFSNGNKYYFVDTKENKTFEVNKDFSYTFTANESSNDRFVVYWNELPAKLGTDDNIVNKNKTFVYKNNTSSNSVRFAKNNLTANITLYNMTGQKLFEKGNVSTSKDFDFSNIENGMYIINIEYSDNTIETLKSIFKK